MQGLGQLYGTDRDILLAQNKLITTHALRERLWANQMDTQQLILQPAFTDRVTVAACLTAAILTWVENDRTPEPPHLIEQAFDTLSHLRWPAAPTPATRLPRDHCSCSAQVRGRMLIQT